MPETIGFSIQGLTRLSNQLKTGENFYPDIADPIIGKHARAEQKALRGTRYPPERPGQTYVRKYFMGGIAGSFSPFKVKAGVWGVENARPYAHYVIGKRQAWMHAGRWWQMKTEMEKRIDDLSDALAKELERRWDRA